jgi:2-haloacid dehalogenase
VPITTVVFDVNETLSDLTPLSRRFSDLGAPEWYGPYWFASTLREGIALAACGDYRPFAEIGRETATQLLRRSGIGDPDGGAERVLQGFLDLPLHPDVADGVRALADAGYRLVTLSNGATGVAEKLLGDHGIRDRFEAVLSVDDAGVWKPVRAVYEYALDHCGVSGDEAVMVAVHPWDLHGAHRAGLRTAWVNRNGEPYPSHVAAPDHTVAAIGELAGRLTG